MLGNLLKDFLQRYWWGIILAVVLSVTGIWWYSNSQKVEISGYKISAEAAKAVEYYKNGELDKAEAQYKLVIKQNPKDWFSWNGLANIYRDKDEYELSEDSYLKSLNINPKFEQAYRNIYVLYYAWSSKDSSKIYKAESVLLQGVKYLPNSEVILEEILNYYQKTNNPDQFSIYQEKLNKLRDFKPKPENLVFE